MLSSTGRRGLAAQISLMTHRTVSPCPAAILMTRFSHFAGVDNIAPVPGEDVLIGFCNPNAPNFRINLALGSLVVNCTLTVTSPGTLSVENWLNVTSRGAIS